MSISYTGEIEIVARTRSDVTPHASIGTGVVVDTITLSRLMTLTGAYTSVGEVSPGSEAVFDLRAALPDLEGVTISATTVAMIAVVNLSPTTGEYITVGAGSNPIVTLWGASGDGAKVGPDSCLILMSRLDGFGTTNGTGDAITLTAGVGAIEYQLMVWWI